MMRHPSANAEYCLRTLNQLKATWTAVLAGATVAAGEGLRVAARLSWLRETIRRRQTALQVKRVVSWYTDQIPEHQSYMNVDQW